MEEIKKKLRVQCEKVLIELEKSYGKQVEYGGTFRSVFNSYTNAIAILKSEESVKRIQIDHWIRPIVDDLGEYDNCLIKEMAKAEELFKKLQDISE